MHACEQAKGVGLLDFQRPSLGIRSTVQAVQFLPSPFPARQPLHLTLSRHKRSRRLMLLLAQPCAVLDTSSRWVLQAIAASSSLILVLICLVSEFGMLPPGVDRVLLPVCCRACGGADSLLQWPGGFIKAQPFEATCNTLMGSSVHMNMLLCSSEKVAIDRLVSSGRTHA